MFSPVFHGTRTSGAAPPAVVAMKLFETVSKL